MKPYSCFTSEFKDQEDHSDCGSMRSRESAVYLIWSVFLPESFPCHVIITGSYLGRLLSKEFFPFRLGDVEDMTLEPLTFAEFTEALGYREIYETTDLFDSRNRSSMPV